LSAKQISVLRLAKTTDLIHTTTFNGAPPAWLAAKIRKKKVIITVHETWIGKWREYTDFGPFKAAMHDLLERAVFMLPFDLYACVSQSTASQLRVAKKKIVTIHNGFDPEIWEKRYPTAPLRKKLKLQNKFIVLGYGRPGVSKGFRHLVAAFQKIKKNMPEAKLLLILSNNPQYAEERKQIKGKDIIVLDPQPYKELPKFVQMADCVAFPSLTEGFGYVALEAAAAQTPLVASNTTSIPEVAWGKLLLVPPRDIDALAKAIEKVKMGKYTTVPKKNFPWATTITAYEKAYKRLL
jgi:glycogen(starch) synthase